MVDTAALTGESVPRRAAEGDEIISGCVNGSGTLKVKVTKAFEDAYKHLYGETRLGNAETEEMRKARPLTDKWTFSTNGVSIMGRNGIPCIGFGPGAEAQAHAPNEMTWKQDLVTCAAVYAALPLSYAE